MTEQEIKQLKSMRRLLEQWSKPQPTVAIGNAENVQSFPEESRLAFQQQLEAINKVLERAEAEDSKA
jgi:hypothetical protein|tara:strand:+ start:334 stop:534 length:201 start_codon:yes stop_codon:yes gene_type:complete